MGVGQLPGWHLLLMQVIAGQEAIETVATDGDRRQTARVVRGRINEAPVVPCGRERRRETTAAGSASRQLNGDEVESAEVNCEQLS